ncbi:putative sodium-dependent multivitamin transporter isoform X2 [Daktulosphaira vitifoliae]|uniref:putative sodium-dependent multivitamin transporter isoform X2 n=1 Tax=Daktulosphaira vitifoliae TaxID=58002 RepID=UPI0021AA6AB9|nr:putative sodium-dependent multivitamin transporter isoform X2 [Daktulosphaira vitifoliae]
MAFGIVDYVVLGVIICISSAIGVYFRFTGGKQKTTQEYMMGNQNQGIIPVAFSLLTVYTSSSSLFGGSAEIYSHGTQFVILYIGYIIGTPIITYVFLPVFFKLGKLSVYEYLEKRFGRLTRTTVSIAFSIKTVLYMAIMLYAPALTFETIIGVSLEFSIVLVGVVCIVYSAIGGIKAIIVTSMFQVIIILGSIFAVIGVAMYETGGLSEIWSIAKHDGRIELNNFNIDPTERHTWLNLTLGGILIYSMNGITQVQVQKYLTMKDKTSAIKCVWLSLPILLIISYSKCFTGLAIYSKYHNCDPVKSGRITKDDQLLSLYVMDTMGNIPGMTGLFVAGVLSSGLSSVSPVINSMAAISLEDYINPFIKDELTDKQKVFYLKLLVVSYGILFILLSFFIKYFGSLLQMSLTLTGVFGGPVVAIFTLGMLIPYANEKGSLTGLTLGLIFSSILCFGGPKPAIKSLHRSISGCTVLNETAITLLNSTLSNNKSDASYFYIYRISYMYYVVLGFAVTFIVGLIVSAMFYDSNRVVDPELFTPFIASRLKKTRNFNKRYSTSMELKQQNETLLPKI